MVCERCAALPPDLRRHPAPTAVRFGSDGRALSALICPRCGGSRSFDESTRLLLDTLSRLDRLRLGAGTPPLLQTTPSGSNAA